MEKYTAEQWMGMMKESGYTLNELSPETLASYSQKARAQQAAIKDKYHGTKSPSTGQTYSKDMIGLPPEATQTGDVRTFGKRDTGVAQANRNLSTQISKAAAAKKPSAEIDAMPKPNYQGDNYTTQFGMDRARQSALRLPTGQPKKSMEEWMGMMEESGYTLKEGNAETNFINESYTLEEWMGMMTEAGYSLEEGERLDKLKRMARSGIGAAALAATALGGTIGLDKAVNPSPSAAGPVVTQVQPATPSPSAATDSTLKTADADAAHRADMARRNATQDSILNVDKTGAGPVQSPTDHNKWIVNYLRTQNVREQKKQQGKPVSESGLVGKQAKLDKNKNGKIDGQDFKMLRRKKGKKGKKLTEAEAVKKENKETEETKTCKCGKKFTPTHGEYNRCPQCLAKQHDAAEKATGVQENTVRRLQELAGIKHLNG